MNSVNTLIEKMRLRQRELLSRFLPASAVKEFYQISEAIDSISVFMLHEEMENRRAKEQVKQPVKRTRPKRVNKASTRERMISFLRANGPSSPLKMRQGLRLPKNSGLIHTTLNQFKNRFFVRVSEGLWALMEQTSNTPAQQPVPQGNRQPIPTGIAAKRVPMNKGVNRNGK